MEINLKLKYLLFAKENNKILKMTTVNKKTLKVYIVEIDARLVRYRFINSENISSIKFENIETLKFENMKDEEDFSYQILIEKYKTPNLKQSLENFSNYYMEIIEQLLHQKDITLEAFRNLSTKKRVYPQIFEHLPYERNNLLFYYFTKTPAPNIVDTEYNKEILLTEQANLSQKKAIQNALNKCISIIEGPPGTGKTTTILNILSNLIYQNKQVLVVSKNNSAIENVEEELEKINIPKCYIRMRKF